MKDATMPKTQPNQALINGLEQMLAKARVGAITDGMIVGIGYQGDGRHEWFHFYSIERDDDVATMIGEIDLYKDVLKASVHNTRNRAASIARVKGVSAAQMS